MKKFILSVSSIFLVSSLFAQDNGMPPMPPVFDEVKKNKSQENFTRKFVMPKSCKVLPQMIVFLPPPMEEDYNRCKNDLGYPYPEFADHQLKKMIKNPFVIKDVSILSDFKEVYKIELTEEISKDKSENRVLFCNSSVTKCIKGDIF